MNKAPARRAPRARAPQGTGASPRIALSLLPDERQALQALCERDGRTLSAMARVIFLRGMQALREAGGLPNWPAVFGPELPANRQERGR